MVCKMEMEKVAVFPVPDCANSINNLAHGGQ